MTVALADMVAPQLPYLRRFARALTGSQDSGDAYVVALLETLVADERNLRRDLHPRPALYQAFIRLWNAMPFNRVADFVEDNPLGNAERRIETLTPLPRQAFLLAAVEQFSHGDISSILGVSAEQARDLIDTAGREIAQQIKADVLIIEDEPLIALDIEGLVLDIGHRVSGIARTRSEAVKLAKEFKPSLILSDIQLADGSSGIDAVADILADQAVAVIYITAYPERLLTGECTEPTFLITKPFRPEMVKAVISQALFFNMKAGEKAA